MKICYYIEKQIRGNYIMKQSERCNIDIRQICSLLLLMIITVLTIYLYNTTQVKSLGFDNDSLSVIKDNFTLIYNSTEKNASLPFNLNEKSYDIVIQRHFSEDELSGGYISFYAYNPACNIYINNQLILHEDSSYDTLNLANPSHWYCFEVPDGDFDLTINMHNNLKLSTIFELYSGSKSAIVFNIIKKNVLSIVLSFITIIIGNGLVIGSVFIKGKLSNRLRWLGITSIDSAIWVYSLSDSSQLIINKTSVIALLGYCSFFMLPLLVTGFLLTYDAFKNMVFVRIFYWSEFAAIVIIFIMQFLNIIQWTNLLIVVHIEVITIILVILISFIRNIRHKISDDNSIYCALLIIGAFIFTDIARYYISKPADGMIKYSTYGLIFLLMYLTYSVIHMITQSSLQEAKNAVYRELAFKDAMTQLENRSAYELKITELRNNNCSSGFILIADLNNLKLINDSYGHQFGDDAITRTASLLRRFFSNCAHCYRTGGDEFCIISDKHSDKELNHVISDFQNAAKDEEALLSYPYSIAIGYGNINADGIDECIKSVDAAMYKNKHDSKKGRAD